MRRTTQKIFGLAFAAMFFVVLCPQLLDDAHAQTGGTISGIVYDAQTCARVSGAQASVQDVFNAWNFTTDINGQFSTSTLAPGQYVVHVTKDGYHYTNVDVTITSGANVPIMCALEPLGKVRGFVRSQGGTPIFNATVTVSSEEGAFALALTDMAGEYLIEGLDDGYYSAVSSALEHVTSDPATAEVAANLTTWHNFTLQRSAYIFGTVTAPTGMPIQYAHVYALDTEGHYADDTTDANGRYNLSTDIAAGAYDLTAEAEGYLSYHATVNIAASEGALRDISLEYSALVTGIVRSNGTTVVQGALVCLTDSGGNVSSNITGADGRYTIDSELDNDTYTLTASAPGHIAYNHPGISISAGSTVTLDISLNLSGTLSGRVTNEDMQPIGNASIDIHNEYDYGDIGASDADGYYSINSNIETGSYTVTISAVGYKMQMLMNVEMTAGQTTTRDIILFPFLKITYPWNGSEVDEPFVNVMGTTEPNSDVVLMIIGDEESRFEMKSDIETGYFEHVFTLAEGNNTISVGSTSPDHYSEEQQISVALVIPPSLDVLKPMDGQQWTDNVLVVEGTASDSSEGTNVSIFASIDNGTSWHLATGKASWKVEINISPAMNGACVLIVKAIEGSGHTAEQKLNLTIAISMARRQVKLDDMPNRDAIVGEILKITMNVKNNGSEIDSFELNCTNVADWSVVLSPSELQNVQPGASRKVTISIEVPNNAKLSSPNFFTINVRSLAYADCTDSSSFAITPKKAPEAKEDTTLLLMVIIYVVAFVVVVSAVFYYRSIKASERSEKRTKGREYSVVDEQYQSYAPEEGGKAKRKR